MEAKKPKLIYSDKPLIKAGFNTWSVEQVARILSEATVHEQARFFNRFAEELWSWKRNEREFQVFSINQLLWSHAKTLCNSFVEPANVRPTNKGSENVNRPWRKEQEKEERK